MLNRKVIELYQTAWSLSYQLFIDDGRVYLCDEIFGDTTTFSEAGSLLGNVQAALTWCSCEVESGLEAERSATSPACS